LLHHSGLVEEEVACQQAVAHPIQTLLEQRRPIGRTRWQRQGDGQCRTGDSAVTGDLHFGKPGSYARSDMQLQDAACRRAAFDDTAGYGRHQVTVVGERLLQPHFLPDDGLVV